MILEDRRGVHSMVTKPFARIFVAAIVIVATFGFVGCNTFKKPETLTTSALREGQYSDASRYAAKWSQKEPSSRLPHFASAVAMYLSGNTHEALDSERGLAFRDSQAAAEQEIVPWIESITQNQSETASVLFLKGLAAQILHKNEQASGYFHRASLLSPATKQYSDSFLSLSASSRFKAGISETDPLQYKGIMRMSHQTWVPDEEAHFEVTNGTLRTKFAGESFSASFGGWSHIKDKKTGDIVGWAANLVHGKVLTRASGDEGSCTGIPNRHWVVVSPDSQDRTTNLDFMGNYQVVDLDAGGAYPMMILRGRIMNDKNPHFALGRTRCSDISEDFDESNGRGFVFFGGNSLRENVSSAKMWGDVELAQK
jgi:hypothetical protein